MKRENARLRLALRLIHGEEPPVVELDEDRVTALLEEEKPAAPDKTR